MEEAGRTGRKRLRELWDGPDTVQPALALTREAVGMVLKGYVSTTLFRRPVRVQLARRMKALGLRKRLP